MEIKRFVSPMLDENMYILLENGHAVMIDPYFVESCNELLEGATPDFMLVTHEHYDHISGVNAYKVQFRIPLYANQICDQNMRDPTKNYAKYEEAYLKFQNGVEVGHLQIDSNYTCTADSVITDGQTIEWMGHRIRFKMAPGHSAGSNLIFLDDSIVFSGDAMLPQNIPVSRFPGGNHKKFLEVTLPYLRSLDGDIMVYPGHDESFRLKEYYQLRECENV